jgi:CBS domain-containing protein
VREVMAPVPVTATPRTTVGEAHRLLAEHKTGHLPVLDDGLLVGIVSLRDLLGADSDALPIGEVMMRSVFVLSPDTPMSRAARIFRRRHVPVLLVLEGRSLAGVVRAVDVLESAWDHAKPSGP